ncbi:MAG: VOC family protein [Actinomycetota bacterium]
MSALPDGLPVDIQTMDHIALATWDVTNAVGLLTNVLGATYVDGGDDPAGFRWLQFRLPGGKVEVLEPLDRDGFLYRFLTKRGEGLHHVTFYVADITDAIAKLRAAGYETVDVNIQSEHWKEAFLHPRDTSGVLIQIAETPVPEGGYGKLRPLEEVLADRPNLKPDQAAGRPGG